MTRKKLEIANNIVSEIERVKVRIDEFKSIKKLGTAPDIEFVDSEGKTKAKITAQNIVWDIIYTEQNRLDERLKQLNKELFNL